MVGKVTKVVEIESKVKEVGPVKNVGRPDKIVEKRTVERKVEGSEGVSNEVFEEVSIKTRSRALPEPPPALEDAASVTVNDNRDRTRREDRTFYETVQGAQAEKEERRQYKASQPTMEPVQSSRTIRTSQDNMLDDRNVGLVNTGDFREQIIGADKERKYNYEDKQAGDMHVKRRKELF